MPPEPFGRDDVAGVLDALAAEVGAPRADAASVVARGRRRVRQRRVRVVAAATFALVTIAAIVVATRQPARVTAVSTSPPPSTTTTLPPATGGASQLAVASATEAWKCVDPLQYTRDGGRTWESVALPQGANAGNCTAVAGGNLWETSSNISDGASSVLRVRDFTDVQVFPFPKLEAGVALFAPIFIDVSHGWVGTYDSRHGYRSAGLYRTVDGGATWTLANDHENFVANLAFTSPSRGWALARRGSSLPPTLLETSDGGVSWTPVDLPAPTTPRTSPGHPETFFRIAAHGSSVVVWGGVVMSGIRFRTLFDVSTDDGHTWAERAGPAGFEIPNANNNTFDAVDAAHFAVTSGRKLRVTDDGGRSWQTRPDMPVQYAPFSINLPTPADIWITDESGNILRSADEGKTWTNLTGRRVPATATTTTTTPDTATGPVPIPLALVSPTEGWICNNSLLYSAHGANTSSQFTDNWHSVDIPSHLPAPPNFQPPLCSAIPGGEAWVLTAAADPPRAQLIRIERGGAKKVMLALPHLAADTNYIGLTFVDASDGWVLSAQTNGASTARLYATEDGGETWTLRNPHAPINAQAGQDQPLIFMSSTEGWALGTSDLEHTTDGGRAWHAVTLPEPLVGAGAAKYVDTVVRTASGAIVSAGGQQTGSLTVPFFDVSTDDGATWATRSGPPGINFGATVPSAFGAIDGDHWQFAYANYLFLTADGGRTWTQVAQFAGMAHATSVAFVTPDAGFVAGVGDPPDSAAAVVLQTLDGGASWSTVAFREPPSSTNSKVVDFPGGIIGCPTRPLTAPPPGNPPAGLVAAAQAFVGGKATVEDVRPVDQPTKSFGNLFGYQVGSCGAQAVADSWVVELSSPSTDRAAIVQTQLALSHSADGWHVFGRYP